MGNLVNQITSSPVWQSGNNAIVLTSDEGNNPNQTVATVVITNHGPRGVKDSTSYDHYSLLASGLTWAVGYYLDANWVDQTLVEHWNGSTWTVIPSPSPGVQGNILYGVAALSDNNVWAVGVQLDANDGTHPLAEHWNGTSWSVVPAPDPNGGGNAWYALDAVSSNSVYAVGQTGTAFPSQALVEHRDGTKWSQLASPADPTESLTTLGITGSDTALTLAGDRESDTTPYTTEVATGGPSSLSLVTSPNNGTGENDLFSATTAADGSTYTAGWYVNPSSGNYFSLIEHGTGGVWSVEATPNPGSGANGFASITAIPGGGLWAVGNYANSGNNATFVAYHC